MMNNSISPADIAAVVRDNDFGGNNGFVWLVLLFALFGNNGWGGAGRANQIATTSDVNHAVDQQTLISKIDGITYGLADSTYALNNTIQNGFSRAELARAEDAMRLQQQHFDLTQVIGGNSRDISQAITNNQFMTNAEFCKTRQEIANGVASIKDMFLQDKLQTLQAENQALRFQASQCDQNAYLINQLRPSPVPAYPVQNPYCNCNCGYTNGYTGTTLA